MGFGFEFVCFLRVGCVFWFGVDCGYGFGVWLVLLFCLWRFRFVIFDYLRL